RLDDVLQSAGEMQAPVRVDEAQVARPEEALRIERRRPRQAVVALHERRAAHHDLALLARCRRLAGRRPHDADLQVLERPAKGAESDRLGIVPARGADEGGRLAHAIASDGLVTWPEEPGGQLGIRPRPLAEPEPVAREVRLLEERSGL